MDFKRLNFTSKRQLFSKSGMLLILYIVNIFVQSALIVGNFTVDEITIGNCRYSCIGGPPSYAGLFLSTYRIKLMVVGCFGREAEPVIDSLRCRGTDVIQACNGCQATSRFRLIGRKKKSIVIIDTGCKIKYVPEGSYDYAILNGVCGEIDIDQMYLVRKMSKFVYLDPQGMLRKRKRGKVELSAASEFIEFMKTVDAIKVNEEELEIIAGTKDPREAYKALGMGPRMIFVRDDIIMQIEKNRVLELKYRPVRVYDGIGMGDLFGAGYVLGNMISDDKMGLAMGHAAAIAKPMERGLLKVPHWREIIDKARTLRDSVIQL